MPPKPKSTRGKSKTVTKPKQGWRVKNPAWNWLELPLDLMENILQRNGVLDILENAQKVCTAWREICKGPSLWKVVYIYNLFRDPFVTTQLNKMCKHAVDRSQGQLLDLTLINVCDDDLLQYVADRSSQLRRLELVFYHGKFASEALKKLPLLEELSLVRINITNGEIEAVSRYCPLLKTLKVNKKPKYSRHEIGFAIGENLPQLTHIQLVGCSIRNTDVSFGYPHADDLLDDYEDDYERGYYYDDLFDYNDYSAFIDDGSFSVELMMK
ncbi:putative F-box/LRR-repeat protein 9, partial [Bidens hawaiensis]|uniref:putative F-box/LRR-repeat protein 9 n=1 Tax=Bidens hawaiensis TaxID=980011 RepID=UPI004049FD39